MRITDDGHVTIPEPLRARAGLTPGTEVEFQLVGDGLVIVRRAGTPTADGTPARPPAVLSQGPYPGKGAALVALTLAQEELGRTTGMTSEEHLAIFGDED